MRKKTSEEETKAEYLMCWHYSLKCVGSHVGNLETNAAHTN